MIFRPATLADADLIVALVERMVYGTAIAIPNPAKVQRIIAKNYLECVFDGDVLAGFMAGHVGETFLNSEVNAYDNGLFIAPEYRGGSAAVKLIKNFEAWAKTQGAQNVWLSQSVGQNQEKTLHFFERLGYVCQGFTTCKKL
jgi:GNAT superfamily N-acetyltransferase